MTMISKKFPTAALIDGEWVTSAKTFAVTDPATGAEVAAVPDLGAKDAKRAIDAAARALPAWSAKTAKERAAILKRWFDLVTAETESLAQLMTTEQGKPLAEARAEVSYGASFIEWFAEEGKRAYGRTIPTTVASKRYLTIKQPIGVVAAIAPWNFPIAMITRKVAPALAAGCTIVVKPAEETPLCALAIAKLAQDAGLPPGVFNIVTTSDAPAVGKVFCEDDRVRKLSFTGSTEVGKILYRQCADTVKKLTLELGGNAPLLVFDDADLDQAVAGAMASKYRNAGQTCVCANRILVQSGIYDRFAAALVEAVKKLVVGPGMEAGTNVGPLINSAAIAKVESLVGDAVNKGAKVLTGGALDKAGPAVLPPVSRGRRDPRYGDRARGDFRPRRRSGALRHRGRRGSARQRHAVRARRLSVQPEFEPRLACRREARCRHGRRQRRHLLQRGRAVRWRQAIRSRPRGRRRGVGGVSRDQIHLPGGD